MGHRLDLRKQVRFFEELLKQTISVVAKKNADPPLADRKSVRIINNPSPAAINQPPNDVSDKLYAMGASETGASKDNPKLTSFDFEGKTLKVNFVESIEVKPGVNCDVYAFDGDEDRDLAIVEVNPSFTTPLQRILQGDTTIEEYISGKGTLTITKPSGEKEVHEVGNSQEHFSIVVAIGEIMQWQASADSKLVFSEICYPPYKECRWPVNSKI